MCACVFVVYQALGALRTLAVDDENARELGNQGACEVVVQGMRAHPHAGGVQVGRPYDSALQEVYCCAC